MVAQPLADHDAQREGAHELDQEHDRGPLAEDPQLELDARLHQEREPAVLAQLPLRRRMGPVNMHRRSMFFCQGYMSESGVLRSTGSSWLQPLFHLSRSWTRGHIRSWRGHLDHGWYFSSWNGLHWSQMGIPK